MDEHIPVQREEEETQQPIGNELSKDATKFAVEIEMDEDEVVHEQTVIDTERVVNTETDIDEVIHKQPPLTPPGKGEQDIDDLMHR